MARRADQLAFIDCPRCERSTRASGVTKYLADAGAFSRRYAGLGGGHIADCQECRTTVLVPTYRQVAVRLSFSRTRGCDGVCTSGKQSCDCRCAGRCHGAGKCYCEVSA